MLTLWLASFPDCMSPAAAEVTAVGNDLRFPLKVAPGGRYLSDAAGKPFLLHGDTAWSLIAQLDREEVEQYLSDRKRRGFNTLLVSLIEHQFASYAPANAYRDPPFLTPGDFSTPNERYFAHVDWVLRRAADDGFLVLLTPSYAGAGGGEQGWLQEMVANGPDKLRQYGRYLGERYRTFRNIVWTHGGDLCPSDKRLVRAVAEGIRSAAPDALHTAHCSRDSAPADHWAGDSWFQISNVYTYDSVLASARREYMRPERRPFFLIEGVYENERSSDEQFLRSQAYQALLSGAAGQVFGNNPIWHFGAGGIYPTAVRWQDALDGRGSRSMSHLVRLFSEFAWWSLEPDFDGTLLSSRPGKGGNRAVAAVTSDRRVAIAYLPTPQEIGVNLDRLAGSRFTGRWFDPATGHFSNPITIPLDTPEPVRFRPTGRNGAGFGDWVFVLEAFQ